MELLRTAFTTAGAETRTALRSNQCAASMGLSCMESDRALQVDSDIDINFDSLSTQTYMKLSSSRFIFRNKQNFCHGEPVQNERQSFLSLVVVVIVAFSLRVRILGEGLMNHSLHAHFFFFF